MMNKGHKMRAPKMMPYKKKKKKSNYLEIVAGKLWLQAPEMSTGQCPSSSKTPIRGIER